MKNILYSPAADAGGGPPKGGTPNVAELQKQLAEANAQIASFKQADAVRTEEEKLIAVKMAAGLTRSQAIAVIARQKAHDDALANMKAERRPRLLEIIKGADGDRAEARRLAKAEFPDLDGSEFAEAAKGKS